MVVDMPAVGVRPGDFLGTDVALGAVTFEELFYGGVGAAFAPNGLCHVTDVFEGLALVVTNGVRSEYDGKVVFPCPGKRLFHFDKSLRLNLGVADGAAPDAAAGLETGVACAVLGRPVEVDSLAVLDLPSASCNAGSLESAAQPHALYVAFTEVLAFFLDLLPKIGGGSRIIRNAIKRGFAAKFEKGVILRVFTSCDGGFLPCSGEIDCSAQCVLPLFNVFTPQAHANIDVRFVFDAMKTIA